MNIRIERFVTHVSGGLIVLLFTVSCHKNLEERAEREARQYTEQCCPTPIVNFTRTDSVVFDRSTRTYHYFCSVSGRMDNAAVIKANQNSIMNSLRESIIQDTSIKAYKDAGFRFAYTLHSTLQPDSVYFHAEFGPKDYQ